MTETAEFTLSVPEAGRRYFGLSRSSAYRAAEKGDLPTIKVGGRLFVPLAKINAMVGRPPDVAATGGHAANA